MDRTPETMEGSECRASQDYASQGTREGSEEIVHSGDESEKGDDPDILMPLNVEIPVNDCLQHVKTHLNHQKSKYAHLFKDDEQLEYFLMLPLSKEQRRILINQLLEKVEK